MPYYTIGIVSRSAKDNYQWLIDHLQKSDIGKWLTVCSVYGSKDHHLFYSDIQRCQFAILYHTRNQGQIFITDVAGALYENELKALSNHLGCQNVLVVLDNMTDCSSIERERILESQSSLQSLTRDLLLFREDVKDQGTLSEITDIIQWRLIFKGVDDDCKPAPEIGAPGTPAEENIQNKIPLEGLKALLEDFQQKMGLEDKDIKKNRINFPLVGMKLVFENGKPVLIREGIKKIRKIPMEGKKVDQQDGKKVLVLEEPGIEQIHKKVPLEGKDIVIENGKPVLLLKDPIIQTVWLQIPLSGQKVAFQEGDDPLLVIEDPGIIQIHKKNPLIVIENAEPGVQKIKDKIPFIVKKIVLKDNKPVLVVEKQESKQKISLEVSLPQVQFVPKEDIHVDESCLLGAGNFGKVFKGCFQGTPAAVKTIRCNDTELNDIFHEIQVSMKLHHPNIVKLMAATKTDTHILLASEYIHGDNLDRILHNPKSIVQISEDDKKYIALEMLLAMEYIHSQNVLHQDVKPANVLVEARSKKALLTDWGMANVRVTICTQMYAKIGPYGGTKMYMAPECTMENKSATKMSDMWSVGATIVELFTKQMPWTSLQEMYPNMFMKQAPKSLASMDGKLPIVKSCFSYDPKQRPTAANMVVAIKNMEGVDLAKHYGFTW